LTSGRRKKKKKTRHNVLGLGEGAAVGAHRPERPGQRLEACLRPARRRSRYGPARPRFTAGGNAGASPKRGFRFSPWSRTGKSNGGKPVEEPLSVTARLRKLFREYGKAAVVVYFTLSVLDFPFFFMIVRIVGTETIGWFSSSDMLPFSFFLFSFFFFSFPSIFVKTPARADASC
jgi:hypothetical protein